MGARNGARSSGLGAPQASRGVGGRLRGLGASLLDTEEALDTEDAGLVLLKNAGRLGPEEVPGPVFATTTDTTKVDEIYATPNQKCESLKRTLKKGWSSYLFDE